MTLENFFISAIGFFIAPILSLFISTWLWTGVFTLRKKMTGKPDSDNLYEFFRRPILLSFITMGVGAVFGYWCATALMVSFGHTPNWVWFLIQTVMWFARGFAQGGRAMHPTNEYSVAAGNIVGLWAVFGFLKYA